MLSVSPMTETGQDINPSLLYIHLFDSVVDAINPSIFIIVCLDGINNRNNRMM